MDAIKDFDFVPMLVFLALPFALPLLAAGILAFIVWRIAAGKKAGKPVSHPLRRRHPSLPAGRGSRCA